MPSAEELIIKKYLQKGWTSKSGELWLHRTDALDFVEDCRRSGLTILGLDFIKEEQGVITLLLATEDFSSISEGAGATQATTELAGKLLQDAWPEGATRVTFVTEETNNDVRFPL